MPPSKSSDHFSPPQDSAGCACRAHHQLLTRATGVSEGNGVTLLRMVRNEERTYMYVGHTHTYIYYICTCTFFNISIRYIHTDSMVNVLHTPMKRIHALIYIYIWSSPPWFPPTPPPKGGYVTHMQPCIGITICLYWFMYVCLCVCLSVGM